MAVCHAKDSETHFAFPSDVIGNHYLSTEGQKLFLAQNVTACDFDALHPAFTNAVFSFLCLVLCVPRLL